MYVNLALNKKLIGCVASMWRYCNCSPNICESCIKAWRHDFVQYLHCKNNPLFHSLNFEIVCIYMIKVLRLHFCYAIPLGQNKTYSINLIKLNTPIIILHKLWSFFGPCNTLTPKVDLNTPMTVPHNPNRNKVNQIRVLQLN